MNLACWFGLHTKPTFVYKQGRWEAQCADCRKAIFTLTEESYLKYHMATITGFYYGDGLCVHPLYARELVKIATELDKIVNHTRILSDTELGEFVRALFENPSYPHLLHLKKTWEL